MALCLQRYCRHEEGTTHKINRLLKQRLTKEKERSMPIAIAVEKQDQLPENVIVEVLSRLPVKDLLQFKSVCKSWYSLISSPAFASKHLENYYYNNNDTWRCLLVQFPIPYAEYEVFELLVDETPRVLADDLLDDMPKSNSYLCGPCDGILYMFHGCRQQRALWNPAINEFKPLPTLRLKPDLPDYFSYVNYEVYGFGLDPVTRDYKVVVVKGYWNDLNMDEYLNLPVSVFVYRLRTNSWKFCGDLPRAYMLEVNTVGSSLEYTSPLFKGVNHGNP